LFADGLIVNRFRPSHCHRRSSANENICYTRSSLTTYCTRWRQMRYIVFSLAINCKGYSGKFCPSKLTGQESLSRSPQFARTKSF